MITSRSLYPMAVLAFAGCAARPPTLMRSIALPPVHLHGRVTYEARHPTLQGTSQSTELRPARWVEVEARDATATVIARTIADGEGRFALDAPASVSELVAIAHARWNGLDVGACPDAAGRTFHEVRRPVSPGASEVDIAATDGAPRGPAGAFHITDTMLTGLETTRRWTGQTLPPLWSWWGRGITDQWSYYHGERPAHSGRYAIELLGGHAGQQQSTDTDEHDEAIVLHEVGHFVFDRLSTDSSIGGRHPGTSLIDPGLAWEEGRATWFGCAVRASPLYQDTIGMEPQGSLRVDRNIEHAPDGPMGNGSEASVSQVLWELSDGADGLPDTDHDGVALGPAAVLRTMLAQREVEGAFPCLADFLRFIVASGAIAQPDVNAMLAIAGEPATLTTAAMNVWPIDIPSLPATVSGKVDGRTDPAPSGGRARPLNGFDAERVYRIHVTSRERVMARLAIDGQGTPADHTDLELEIRSIRAETIASAHGPFAVHLLSHVFDPGYYIVYVRDAGTDGGNKAGYTLELHATPIP